MMTSALGKVRTAATFSFVIGVVGYFSLAAGFLIWGALRRDVYKNCSYLRPAAQWSSHRRFRQRAPSWARWRW